MAKIIHCRSGEVLVDDDVYEWASRMSWSLSGGKFKYPKTGLILGGKRQTTIFLHHLIVGRGLRGLVVDHINGNRLDNRRDNLRLVTQQQNNANRRERSWNVTGIRGVCPERGKFKAYIMYKGQAMRLGFWDTLEEAVEVKRKVDLALNGEFSALNREEYQWQTA